MRPYSRTRKPLQQSGEKSRSPFFSGPEKNEKAANSSFFQAKLEVGGAGDPLEKEADKVADSVVAQKTQPEAKKEEAVKPVAATEEKKEKGGEREREKRGERGRERERERERGKAI